MNAPSEKYAARIDELDSLKHELENGRRPGDPAPVIGRVLEAAGDVLRRATAIKANAATIEGVLALIPEPGLRSWGDGVAIAELRTKLQRAASQAVEAAIPDSAEDGETMAGWAMQDLSARDRLESALVALEALGSKGRSDARALHERLRRAVEDVDAACRAGIASLTALNGHRRAEAALIDAAFRPRAWWYCERNGIDDDALVKVLGGETQGALRGPERIASTVVSRKRTRKVGFDDLLRFDLGLATTAEQEVMRRQAEKDPELKLALAAMAAADETIDELTRNETSPQPGAPIPFPVEPRGPAPEIIEERTEFKVLLFRTKSKVQVVVQPRRQDRFKTAAVYRSDEPNRAFPAEPGDMGLHFDLGPPEGLAGSTARVVVKLNDGQTHAFEVKL